MRGTCSLAAIALAAALGACVVTEEAADTSVVSANPDQVTIRFQEGDLDAARRSAQDLCANYGRTAQLRAVTPSLGAERIGTFDCR